MIRINGKEAAADGMRLADYLLEHGYEPNRIAIECNEEILPKSEYETKILEDGDVLEIVSFVGGG